MSIRNKLLSIVVGFVVLISVSFGSYLAFQVPIQRMEAERSVIYDYEAAILNLLVQTNCILTRPTQLQLGIFEEKLKGHDEIFERLSKLSHLPSASKESAQAFKAALALRALYATKVNNVLNTMKEAYEVYRADFEFTRVRLLTDLKDRDISNPEGLTPYIYTVSKERDAAYDALDLADKKARVLIDTAEKEIAAARASAFLISAGLTLLVIVAGVILVSLMSRSMVGSIATIQKAIKAMAEGRVGRAVPDLGKDELGAVSRDLNRLNAEMAKALSNIKESAAVNEENAAGLGRSVEEFSSSSYEIGKNADMIGERMAKADRLASKAIADMESITAAIGALDKGIDNQSALVADSGAAVSQMLASIENIGRISEADSRAADELSAKAEQGMTVVDGTFAKVAEIGSSVDDIQEMVQIISGIAGQTNLLAMNAEIEAAHAGEAGKGFSVVAGEIRNLAEAAGASSREIDERTRAIIDAIEEASKERELSVAALKGIIDGIKDVTRSVSEIYSNVAEIRTGSRQIQESVESLRSESRAIGEESTAVAGRAASTRESFLELGRISHETAAGIDEMGKGLAQVTRSLEGLSAMAGSLGETGAAMKKAVDAFTIEA